MFLAEVIGMAILGCFLFSKLAVDCHEYELFRDDYEIFGDE
jgi:hypothetical protein